MAKKRKVHSAQFKAGTQVLGPSQPDRWKRQLLEQVPDVFQQGGSRVQDEEAQMVPELYQQIGRLQVELDWLKKT